MCLPMNGARVRRKLSSTFCLKCSQENQPSLNETGNWCGLCLFRGPIFSTSRRMGKFSSLWKIARSSRKANANAVEIFPWSLIEKRKRDENPEDSIRRGIREELGIHDGYTLKRLDQVTDEMRPSISYPGTYIVVMAYNFEADLTTAVYHPEGYIEAQRDKTTYFIWKNV
jgi:hypothetical protein